MARAAKQPPAAVTLRMATAVMPCFPCGTIQVNFDAPDGPPDLFVRSASDRLANDVLEVVGSGESLVLREEWRGWGTQNEHVVVRNDAHQTMLVEPTTPCAGYLSLMGCACCPTSARAWWLTPPAPRPPKPGSREPGAPPGGRMIRQFVEQAKATRVGSYQPNKPDLHVHGSAGCCGDIKVLHGGDRTPVVEVRSRVPSEARGDVRGRVDVPRCLERRVDVRYLPDRVSAGDALVLAGWALREAHCCVDSATWH